MPHAIIEGPVTPEDIWRAFAPVELVDALVRFRAEEAFLSTDRQRLLVRGVTVERGFTKLFVLRIQARDGGGIHVGIDPLVPVEKSEGVKRAVGLVAWKILASEPEARVVTTNIDHYIGEPKA